jgi:hypothetical protein
LALVACGETSTAPLPQGPHLTLQGTVTTSGTPIAAAEVWLRLYGDSAVIAQADTTPVTDNAGRVATTLSLDSVFRTGHLDVYVRPPYGSGLEVHRSTEPLSFDPDGIATLSFTTPVLRAAPPVPSGSPAHFDPATLLGLYAGATVPPEPLTGTTFLTVEITSTSPSLVGRYSIDFTGSVTCGNGAGTVLGIYAADTVALRLVGDTVQLTPLVETRLQAVTFDATADTLILSYPPNAGDCDYSQPAPLRLVRQ